MNALNPEDWHEVDPDMTLGLPAHMIANAPEDDLPEASAGAFIDYPPMDAPEVHADDQAEETD